MVSIMAKVKVCGITNLADAVAAVELGADALGFVFARSPRQVTAEAVRDIISELPPFVSKVGVFINSELALVRETMSFCGLDLVQLHGDEEPEYCAALFPRAIKVFTINNLPAKKDLIRYRVAAFMLDKDKGAGTNDAMQEALWRLAFDIKRYGPVILAGGLTVETVGQAIRIAQPYAVDVCSGVELVPGKKDHTKLRSFLEIAKLAQSGGKIEIT